MTEYTLESCPPGLFMFEGILCFKAEYSIVVSLEDGGTYNQPDAYCVESGEYFWGGATSTLERSKLRVTPVMSHSILPKFGVNVDNSSEIVDKEFLDFITSGDSRAKIGAEEIQSVIDKEIIDEALSMSDQEILDEIRSEGEDPSDAAEEVRSIVDKAISSSLNQPFKNYVTSTAFHLNLSKDMCRVITALATKVDLDNFRRWVPTVKALKRRGLTRSVYPEKGSLHCQILTEAGVLVYDMIKLAGLGSL